MDRRDFLQAVAATAAAEILSGRLSASAAQTPAQKAIPGLEISLAGYSLIAEFKNEVAPWKVYEDLRTREGALVFVSSAKQTRMLSKSAEASMAEGPPYLGLSLKDIGLSSPDLLAGGGDRGDSEIEFARTWQQELYGPTRFSASRGGDRCRRDSVRQT